MGQQQQQHQHQQQQLTNKGSNNKNINYNNNNNNHNNSSYINNNNSELTFFSFFSIGEVKQKQMNWTLDRNQFYSLSLFKLKLLSQFLIHSL